MTFDRFVATLLAVLLVTHTADSPLIAQEKSDSGTKTTPVKLGSTIEVDNESHDPMAQDDTSVTHGSVKIDGKAVEYTATASFLPLKGEDGKSKAEVFSIAYTVEGTEPGKRPITFCFNGGPGSSSVWLHLGMVGPKRVKMPDDAKLARPPYELVANPYSLLDVTDIVLIDPVSTGYSRPDDVKQRSKFHGYDEDIRSVGEFIRLYLTRHGRWGSPKYLLGESYGTMRAAGLSGHLQSRYNIELNGIVLVSSVLDFTTLRFGRDNDLPHILFLPGYTATAWYHGRLSKDLQKKPLRKVLDEAEAFAMNDYANALLRGDALPKQERRRIVAEFARLTGLKRSYVERANLRIPMWAFGQKVLDAEKSLIGRFDSRYRGPQLSGTSESSGYDASGAAIFGPYTAAMNDYLRRDLGVKRDDVYEILTSKVHPWNYSSFENRYVSSTSALRTAMVKNPFLEVFIANGYYDLATPYFATEYTFDHLNLPGDLRKNVHMGYYEAGHMMYVHEPSLKKLRQDLLKFYAGREK